MSWPDIIFSEADKVNFQRMALELEKKIEVDAKSFKDLDGFSKYPPFMEALRLAKEKRIDRPLVIPNTNYWYCETNLQSWMQEEGTGLLSRFLSAIEGFPYEAG